MRVVGRNNETEASEEFNLRDAGVGLLGNEPVIAILGKDPADIQTVQNNILFPDSDSGKEIFEQPGVKLLYITSSSPPCWQSYAGLSGLVIATPTASLSRQLREAITIALLKGVHLLIVDSYEGNSAFLESYTQEQKGPARAGDGLLCRTPSLQDRSGYECFNGFLYPQRGTDTELLRPSDIRGVLDEELWAREKFKKPHLPRPRFLLTALGLYIFFLGPLNYYALRARDQREKGWITTLAISIAFSGILVPWIYFHQYHDSQLDSTVFIYSNDTHSDSLASLRAQISSPVEHTYTVNISSNWKGIDPGRQRFETLYKENAVEISNIHAPKWSGTSLSMTGLLDAPGPVVLNDGSVVNKTQKTFLEAVFLTANGYYKTKDFGPGKTWTLRDPMDLHSITGSLSYRMQGREDEGKEIQLIDTIAFLDTAQQETILRTARGIFIGSTGEETLSLNLDHGPDIRKAWTVYFEVIENNTLDKTSTGSKSHA